MSAETQFFIMKTKQQKQEILENLNKKLSDSKVVLFGFIGNQRGKKGLDNKTLVGLKKELRKTKSDFIIAKKSLTKLAIEKSKMPEIDFGKTEGSLGIVFGYDDAVEPAKAFHKTYKANENSVMIFGGILDGKILSSQEVVQLAKLPTKEILLSQLVGAIKSPLYRLHGSLSGQISGLISVLSQIKK